MGLDLGLGLGEHTIPLLSLNFSQISATLLRLTGSV